MFQYFAHFTTKCFVPGSIETDRFLLELLKKRSACTYKWFKAFTYPVRVFGLPWFITDSFCIDFIHFKGIFFNAEAYNYVSFLCPRHKQINTSDSNKTLSTPRVFHIGFLFLKAWNWNCVAGKLIIGTLVFLFIIVALLQSKYTFLYYFLPVGSSSSLLSCSLSNWLPFQKHSLSIWSQFFLVLQ